MSIVGLPPETGQQTPPSRATSLTGGTPVMGKDDFLKLLVTQLSNQDPLNPMDGQQFAAQLAQFSSVEQLIGISDGISAQSELNGLMAQNINNGVATGLIGQEIDAESNQINLTAGSQPTLAFELGSAATEVEITIRDASGKVVRTLSASNLLEGRHEMNWTGRDSQGNALSEGAYTFTIKAADVNGDAVTSAPRLQGVVDRVSFGPEGIQLWVGGSPVSLSAVVSVEQSTND